MLFIAIILQYIMNKLALININIKKHIFILVLYRNLIDLFNIFFLKFPR